MHMKKEHLFFDFDGMTFDTLPSTLLFINQTYNTDIKLNEIVNRGSEIELIIQKHTGDLSITKRQFYKLYNENYLMSLERHKDIQPMKNAPQVIRALREKYILHTLTARQFTGFDVIKYMIDTHLGGAMQHIHCVSRVDPDGKTKIVTKREYVDSIDGYKIAFFDDSLHEVNDMRGAVPSFLFDPHNYHPEIDPKRKTTDWIQIGDMYL